MFRRAAAKSVIALKPQTVAECALFAARPRKRQAGGGAAGNIVERSPVLYRLGSRRRASHDTRRTYGHVAEWLRTGLQNRVRRFNSGRGLQSSSSPALQ